MDKALCLEVWSRSRPRSCIQLQHLDYVGLDQEFRYRSISRIFRILFFADDMSPDPDFGCGLLRVAGEAVASALRFRSCIDASRFWSHRRWRMISSDRWCGCRCFSGCLWKECDRCILGQPSLVGRRLRHRCRNRVSCGRVFARAIIGGYEVFWRFHRRYCSGRFGRSSVRSWKCRGIFSSWNGSGNGKRGQNWCMQSEGDDRARLEYSLFAIANRMWIPHCVAK